MRWTISSDMSPLTTSPRVTSSARDVQFTRAKSFDTFCPVGPVIQSELDPAAVSVRAIVDGETRQDGHTSDMVFGPRALIAYISRVMTLNPGDLVLTGTPSGVGPLHAGERVRVEVDGVGGVTNPVRPRVRPNDRPEAM